MEHLTVFELQVAFTSLCINGCLLAVCLVELYYRRKAKGGGNMKRIIMCLVRQRCVAFFVGNYLVQLNINKGDVYVHIHKPL